MNNYKVAVDKEEIDKLIMLRKYSDAIEHIKHVRDVIELVVVNRLDTLIKQEIIVKKEENTFYKIIRKGIIDKLLEDKDYVLMDESYVYNLKDKVIDLKKYRKTRT